MAQMTFWSLITFFLLVKRYRFQGFLIDFGHIGIHTLKFKVWMAFNANKTVFKCVRGSLQFIRPGNLWSIPIKLMLSLNWPGRATLGVVFRIIRLDWKFPNGKLSESKRLPYSKTIWRQGSSDISPSWTFGQVKPPDFHYGLQLMASRPNGQNEKSIIFSWLLSLDSELFKLAQFANEFFNIFQFLWTRSAARKFLERTQGQFGAEIVARLTWCVSSFR